MSDSDNKAKPHQMQFSDLFEKPPLAGGAAAIPPAPHVAIHEEGDSFSKRLKEAFREVSIWPAMRMSAPTGLMYQRDQSGDHGMVWKTGTEIPLSGRDLTAVLTTQQPDLRTPQQSWSAAIAWTPWQVGRVHLGVIGGDVATFTNTKVRFTAPDDAQSLLKQGGLYLGTHDEQSGFGLSATVTTSPTPDGSRDVRGYIGAKLKF